MSVAYKSVSANDTDNRIAAAINQCQVGYSRTADFIAPRRHYHCLQSADGHMSLQLLCIDQARIQCESAVSAIARDPKLWRGHLKLMCRKLSNKNVTYPLPVCNEVNQAITRNLTEDELMSFALMASHIDDVIHPELSKLANTVHITIGRERVPNQSAMTSTLSCYLYCMIAKEIIKRCNEVQRGSKYFLCTNPMDASSRNTAFEIGLYYIDRMLTILQQIIKDLAENQTFQVPYTNDMANGVTIICSKMTDVVTIYSACVEGGVNAGHRTFAELEADLKQKLDSRSNRAAQDSRPISAQPCSAPNQPISAPNQPISADTDLSALFAQKGWSVKK